MDTSNTIVIVEPDNNGKIMPDAYRINFDSVVADIPFYRPQYNHNYVKRIINNVGASKPYVLSGPGCISFRDNMYQNKVIPKLRTALFYIHTDNVNDVVIAIKKDLFVNALYQVIVDKDDDNNVYDLGYVISEIVLAPYNGGNADPNDKLEDRRYIDQTISYHSDRNGRHWTKTNSENQQECHPLTIIVLREPYQSRPTFATKLTEAYVIDKKEIIEQLSDESLMSQLDEPIEAAITFVEPSPDSTHFDLTDIKNRLFLPFITLDEKIKLFVGYHCIYLQNNWATINIHLATLQSKMMLPISWEPNNAYERYKEFAKNKMRPISIFNFEFY